MRIELEKWGNSQIGEREGRKRDRGKEDRFRMGREKEKREIEEEGRKGRDLEERTAEKTR